MNYSKTGLPVGASKEAFGLPISDDGRTARRSLRTQTMALINPRTLERECFVRSIELSHPRVSVVGYGSPQEWREDCDGQRATVVLYNIGARAVSDRETAAELAQLVEEAQPAPVIVLAESEDLREMIAAIDCGAKGYIPASVSFEVIVEATRLASCGGMFLPAASVLSLRDAIAPKPEPASGAEELLTSRQAAVADALRRGKANKIIAYELNMSESTVKVHIRNIMKKLKATNRTEAAFRLNALHAAPSGAAS
jgi:DNA-binding NarL/FixJ family response regulator